MSLLQNVEEPQSDIEEYVDRLDSVLLKKMDHILGLRSQLAQFYKHLKKEEKLQKLYARKLDESGLSHPELQQQNMEQQQLQMQKEMMYYNNQQTLGQASANEHSHPLFSPQGKAFNYEQTQAVL